MSKCVIVYGAETLKIALHRYVGKTLNIHKSLLTSVKSNRTWRKHRHIKSLYTLAGFYEYSCYKLKQYELVFDSINGVCHEPNPRGTYLEWVKL